MKEFLFVIGGASLAVGVYLEVKKRQNLQAGRRNRNGRTVNAASSAPSTAGITITGPGTDFSSSGGADNTANPVESYSSSLNWPISTIQAIPGSGPGTLDDMNAANIHQFVR